MLTVKQVASIFISPYIAAQRNIQYYNNYIKNIRHTKHAHICNVISFVISSPTPRIQVSRSTVVRVIKCLYVCACRAYMLLQQAQIATNFLIIGRPFELLCDRLKRVL